jgi:hypothetical protein
MHVEATRIHAKRLGQDITVMFRPLGDEMNAIADLQTRSIVVQKLERHRRLMTDIFAQLMAVGAPLQVAMKFLPKDAVVSVCDTGSEGGHSRTDAD